MKNTSKFSASQTEAITAFGKDVAVSAGAGSGKTTVLVERFLRAATLAGSAPEKILAITFTEKAAQEMKTRLVRLCEERGLPELRKRLENAPVSTIDSFCAKLLRENPVEAGVDPYFQILGEGEAELLVNRLLDEIFREEAEGDACFKLLSDYGEDPLRKMLKRHYSRSRSRRDGSPLLQARDHEALLRQTLGQVKAVAEKIMAETAGKKELGDTEAGLREAASGFLGLIAGNAGERRWETYQAVAEAAGKIKKRGRLKELAEEMAALSERWRECLAQKMGEPVKREFARIYALFEQRYEAEKRRLAAYDFTDLLSKAGALLERKDAAGKALLAYYREFFSHILVDEYQDTSPLQAEFIDLLKKKNNLFVVGDEKQSIYGFREADPVILKNKMDSSKVVRLNENYRSRPQVLTWINTFSRHILPPEMYQELLPKRTFETKIDHGVELLCVVRDREEAEGVDEARAAEAAILARHIRALVESGRNVEPKGGAVRPLRYGDIAILLRSTTASHLYEKELFDERIPFHVVKGKGFYDKPEIRDLLHFLKWIDNPELDISLACILRSPLFGVSDDGLFWIAKSAKKEDAKTPLFAALIKGAPVDGLGEKDAGKLGFFLEFQENLRKHKNRYRISEILERLLQETAYESKILTGADGRRKVANVRKLVEMARGVEDNYIFGIGDFVCYAESLAAREVVEEEAKIEPEASDAVVISSIHAAKGLEFPCVIVADLGRRGQISDARFLSSDAEGLGIKLKNPVTLEYVKDVSFTRIREEIVRREAAEEARLLYVAMTRAEELLILSGSASLDAKTGEIKKDSSWMGRILEKTGIDPRNAAGAEYEGTAVRVLGLTADNLPAVKSVPAYADLPDVRVKLLQGELLTRAEAVKAGAGYDEAAAKAILGRLQLVRRPYTSLHDASVTDLLSREKGEEEPDRPTLGFSDETNLPRNEFGTLFHKLMELSLYRVRKKQTIGESVFKSLLTGLNAAERKEAVQGMVRFWKSPLGQEIRRSPKCYPELPFIYKTPYGLLKGQIDLVYQKSPGHWVILDYKTNQIAKNQVEKAAEEYEFQLGLYSLVFGDLTGEIPAQGALYFMSPNETHSFNYTPAAIKAIRERLLAVFQTIV